MIKHLFAIMVVAASATASATPLDLRNDVQIQRNTLGSGQQGERGFESSTLVLDNDIFHAPQYMPFYPTAGSIWPRVVEVQCVRVGTTVVASVDKTGAVANVQAQPALKCEGYDWSPKLGRGEYLFFKPVIKEETPPVVEVRERTVTVIKEVPAKKVRQ